MREGVSADYDADRIERAYFFPGEEAAVRGVVVVVQEAPDAACDNIYGRRNAELG